MNSKKDVIKNIKELSKNNQLYFAGDDDREGEAISWHCAIIAKSNFDDLNRIKYREISKNAIINSLKNPIKININEVNSQQARVAIDLLIGFKILLNEI